MSSKRKGHLKKRAKKHGSKKQPSMIITLRAPPNELAKVALRPRQQPDIPIGAKCFFFKLPLELRDKIYGHLLIVRGSIKFMKAWHTLFYRQRMEVHTSILAVNKKISQEAVRVMMSKNTFTYIPRELPPGEYEFSSFIKPEARYIRRENSRKIQFDKVSHLARRLEIWIDANRFDSPNMDLAAKAIQELNLPSNGINLDTFRITFPNSRADKSVLPLLWKWFSKGGEVVKALRTLRCNFIEIDFHGGRTSGRPCLKTRLDMRYSHAAGGAAPKDGLEERLGGDAETQRIREEVKKKVTEALDTLRWRVEGACLSPEKAMEMGLWEEKLGCCYDTPRGLGAL
ncbi:hypothetical protein NKR23_g5166 [Pleurostoma richardsiae]|jgi:hypothetical protein|uniref:Uncharacterized protein n=1 Tax=Pleurostoma richardsiae TaxID=41990 RepID=A0AA38VR63_9PEZI|nr:hypothetical protein NKR23_g5166 [Pleurostoma richardsiae]